MPILLRCLLSEFYKILICKILQSIITIQKQFNHFCTYFTYLLYIHITIAIQITYIIRANTFVLSRFSHGIRTQRFSREKNKSKKEDPAIRKVWHNYGFDRHIIEAVAEALGAQRRLLEFLSLVAMKI